MPLLFHRREEGTDWFLHYYCIIFLLYLFFFSVYNNNKCTVILLRAEIATPGRHRSAQILSQVFYLFSFLTLLDSFFLLSDASYAATGGRIVRRSAGTGGSGTASVQYASGSAGSVRPIGQTSTCIHPRCTGTASHL